MRGSDRRIHHHCDVQFELGRETTLSQHVELPRGQTHVRTDDDQAVGVGIDQLGEALVVDA